MSATAPLLSVPEVDGRTQAALTPAQADAFRAAGLLVIRNLLGREELHALQAQTQTLIDRARAGWDDPDVAYREHELTGERVPHRIEYVIDRTDAGKVLLGHHFILRSVELLQGPGFIPTWDSLVFKNPGAGVAVPWHRDAGTEAAGDARTPIFNVDFYLDRATTDNCVWGIPGTNLWSVADAQAAIERLNRGGFGTEGAIPITMEPGDVILHNILVLHGSRPSLGPLRRVIYYEFRPGPVERQLGPHVPAYAPLKQRVLEACLRRRARCPYTAGETPYQYRIEPGHDFPHLGPNEEPPTFRYPHHEYWRR